MIEYNGFKLYDCMPEGFRIDKTCGSPLAGYDFATNGKSVLNGQIRILVKSNNYKKNNIEKEVKEDKIILNNNVEEKIKKNKDFFYDSSSARAVNELARKRFEEKMLKDILIDLTICEIEGWGKKEYIQQLQKSIKGLLKNKPILYNTHKDQGLLFGGEL